MDNSTSNYYPTSHAAPGAWRQRYERLGLQTLPLIGKKPFVPGSWKTTDPDSMWRTAGPDFAGNIGILLGNGLAVADADDEHTGTSIANGLCSMGLLPVWVKTPHGAHFYLRVADMPMTFNSSRLPAELGIGELRGRNSYVVAPFSQVGGLSYRWANGEPEDLMRQRMVEWRDLRWLLREHSAISMIDTLPIRLLHRKMPHKAELLLEGLSMARKGESIDRYPSRSEAEAAIISILILAGHTYEEILSTFEAWRPGKYSESMGRDRQRYFDRTYYGALSKIAAHPTRAAVATSWQAVRDSPSWPGANGFLKRDTLLALLALCWQFGTWEVYASQRSVAEYVATTQASISRTMRVLEHEGYIDRLSVNRTPADAIRWQIHPLDPVSSEAMTCDADPRALSWHVNELWSRDGLGRCAGTIYQLLSKSPLSVRRLAQSTGKAWSTVDAALQHLEKSRLATKVEDGWVRAPRTLEEVAAEFSTKTRAHRRRERHAWQRECFAEQVEQRRAT